MNRDAIEKLIRDLRKPWTIAENMQPLIIQAADALDDALARLEDAEAAQALVVERAAAIVEDSDIPARWLKARAIRALAPASGVEALATLRAERDVLRADRDSAARMWQAAEQEKDAAVARSREASKMLAIETNHAAQAEAERDDLRTRLAAAEERVAALTEAGKPFLTKPVLADNRALIRAVDKLRAALATVTPPADTGEGRT